jgi:succinate-semialdehyde dehydrogenase/glutarate-semialdehyde dehydrogenase
MVERPAWRAKTAMERAHILRKMYDLMMANQEDLPPLGLGGGRP